MGQFTGSWEELPSMSYTAATGSTYSLGNTGGLAANITTSGALGDVTFSKALSSMLPMSSQLITGSPTQIIQEKIVARLIRYTVVDPDPRLAEQKPEIAILMSGVAMLNGQDDKGFLMELAPTISAKVSEHNLNLQTMGWEDKEGKTHPFKTRRLSSFDVVIEVLKDYK